MAESIENLRKMSDDEVVRRHDHHANNTVVGTRHYLDELDRRSRERSAVASENLARQAVALARRTYWLTWTNTALALVASVVAVLALGSCVRQSGVRQTCSSEPV